MTWSSGSQASLKAEEDTAREDVQCMQFLLSGFAMGLVRSNVLALYFSNVKQCPRLLPSCVLKMAVVS